MRAARLISLVLLLQVREFMTGVDLANELEVSERTISRDILALSEAGVPIYAERGRSGGYRLLEGYRSRLTGLHRSEAEAVFLAGVPGPAGEMGMADAVETARLKVSAALAPVFRDAPARVAQRFHLDAPQWFRDTPTPPLLSELARAVWQDRWVHARYRRRDGEGRRQEEVCRELAPYGLVLKAGVWYLAASSADRFVVYRVERFSQVRVTEEFFVRDKDFELPAFWEQRATEFARSLLTERIDVRLSPDGLRTLRAMGDRMGVEDAVELASEPDQHGWVSITLPVESLEIAYHQLLQLGPEAEVRAPVELRQRLAATATRWVAVYAA